MSSMIKSASSGKKFSKEDESLGNKRVSHSHELFIVMGCFLFCVSSYTVLNKYQDVTKGKNGRPFSHPYFQTFVCALGESCALWVFIIARQCKKKK
jgi:hypothetical protein